MLRAWRVTGGGDSEAAEAGAGAAGAVRPDSDAEPSGGSDSGASGYDSDGEGDEPAAGVTGPALPSCSPLVRLGWHLLGWQYSFKSWTPSLAIVAMHVILSQGW